MAQDTIDRKTHWSKRGTPVAQRFWKHVSVAGLNDCWKWLAHRSKSGYGNIGIHGRPRLAHRVSWEINIGPIPDGMLVCHHCDNPSCVNPNHLFLGSVSDNVRDSIRKGRFSSARRLEAIPRGVRSPRSVLNDELVREIRRMHTTGTTTAEISRHMGVKRGAVRSVLGGRTWRHVV